MHLLPVRRTRAVPPDRKAFELLPDDDAYKIREKEAYNSFLRRKVHAMLVAMAAGAARYDFDYAFLLDYDTAVNVTNLQQFANALPGGATRRSSWAAASSGLNQRAAAGSGSRGTCARSRRTTRSARAASPR